MLEDYEWAVVAKAHNARADGDNAAAFSVLQESAQTLGLPAPIQPTGDTKPIAKAFWHLIAGYHMFTGVLEKSPNPIWHHVIGHHGPPCENCGKLLRTKRASYCVACGAIR